jgi:hypothetical protein
MVSVSFVLHSWSKLVKVVAKNVEICEKSIISWLSDLVRNGVIPETRVGLK